MYASIYLTSLLAFGAGSALGRPAHQTPRGSGIGKYIEDAINRWTDSGNGQQDCMPREDALKTAETFQSLIRGYTKEQALAALTPDFVDHTSAVSIIINRGGSAPENLTEPVFTSRDEFMEGHGTQEPIP